jgi:hypothetical protein
LARRGPNTGLNDTPEIVAFLGMIFATESLAARLTRSTSRGIEALAEALREAGADALAARLAAAQVIVTQQQLAVMNHAALADGESADSRYPEAARAAHRAFDLLDDGLRSRLTLAERT